jgi:hypothetical protein
MEYGFALEADLDHGLKDITIILEGKAMSSVQKVTK